MTDEIRSPQRWAFDLTHVLNALCANTDRFPVDVSSIAKDYSKHRFPDDPITLIKGTHLDGFEGALFRAPTGKKGWGIIYNSSITSIGRINFTLAHEFGHYLLHRLSHPEGIQCSTQDVIKWNSEYGKIENQANEFASTLLMPLDDFRIQIANNHKPTLDELGSCADRYNVSLIAAVLRWLDYTHCRACRVVSRDGFVLWARSSSRALRTRIYFKTSDRPPIPIPPSSLAALRRHIDGSRASVSHNKNIWFPEPCDEDVLFADQYDFTMSLLHFEDASPQYKWNRE